jgi:hypothetical protein
VIVLWLKNLIDNILDFYYIKIVMPLYSSKNNGARQLMNKYFKNEKELQDYMERNLQELLNVRFLASQYFT